MPFTIDDEAQKCTCGDVVLQLKEPIKVSFTDADGDTIFVTTRKLTLSQNLLFQTHTKLHQVD